MHIAREANRSSSGRFDAVEPAFLELGQPDLDGAVARLVEGGARRIVIVPYFLTPGKHLQRDLPRIVADLAGLYPGVDFTVTPPLDGHPALIDALLDRAHEAVTDR